MWDYGHFWWEVRDVPGWNGKGSGIGRGDGEGFGKHRGYVRSWEDDGLVCRGGLGNASAHARCGDRAYSFGFPSQHGCFSSFFFRGEAGFGHADVHLLVSHVVTELLWVDPFGSGIVFQ